MAGSVYESSLAWDPQRPQTTIITCVDGRWYPHFQEFARVHLNAGPRTDFVAVPGGIEPLTLMDLVPKDFNFLRRRLESLVEAHGTRRIALRITNRNEDVTLSYRDGAGAWHTLTPGYAIDRMGDSLSGVRVALFVHGSGSARFHSFTYHPLQQ